MTDVLLSADHGSVRLLTLNRPAARNALSLELIDALYTALGKADADDEVRVIVLAGSDPAFCAGLDLKELAIYGATFLARLADKDCVGQVAALSKPVVAAVNGSAMTGGLEVALGCDFMIASDRAVFADTHARVGLLPTGGMTARLPLLVGSGHARRMSMTGELVDADSALKIGLVTEVVPHAELIPRALTVASTIAAGAPDTMRDLKRVYVQGAAYTSGHAVGVEVEIAAGQQHDWSTFESRRQGVLEGNRAQLG